MTYIKPPFLPSLLHFGLLIWLLMFVKKKWTTHQYCNLRYSCQNGVSWQLLHLLLHVILLMQHVSQLRWFYPTDTKHWNYTPLDIFLQGVSQGFRIGFAYSSVPLKSAKQNLKGACFHLKVVEKYLQTEVNLIQVTAPFYQVHCQSVRLVDLV